MEHDKIRPAIVEVCWRSLYDRNTDRWLDGCALKRCARGEGECEQCKGAAREVW